MEELLKRAAEKNLSVQTFLKEATTEELIELLRLFRQPLAEYERNLIKDELIARPLGNGNSNSK